MTSSFSARGKFIVFEGIDGCGKSTQIKLAAGFMFDLNKDNDVYLTREPTRNIKALRDRMSSDLSIICDPEWCTQNFVLDRRDHVDRYIDPFLWRGVHVLCDRYKHSTLAYQHTQGIELQHLIDLHEDFPVPDLTLFFDCPVLIAFERRKKDGATDAFDKDLKFQEKLHENYLKIVDILKLKGEPIVVIDAEKKIEDVYKDVASAINELF